MIEWLLRLRLPWDNLPRRWAITLANADISQKLVNSANIALTEWWPSTCREQTLEEWGRILKRPRRDGESVADYRRRLTDWRSEPVGTRGWVLDEVARLTGAQRVIEFPFDGCKYSYARYGAGRRYGRGPKLTVGADINAIASVRERLGEELPPDIAISVIPSADFDRIR